MERVIKHWNRLPGGLMGSPSMVVLKETFGCGTRGHGLVMGLNRSADGWT